MAVPVPAEEPAGAEGVGAGFVVPGRAESVDEATVGERRLMEERENLLKEFILTGARKATDRQL